jgi:hypothetical protein
MGYLPTFVLARSGYRMVVERPPVLGGLALLAGWASASKLHTGAAVEPDRAEPRTGST